MLTQSINLIDLHNKNHRKTNKLALNCKTSRIKYKQVNLDRHIFLVKCKENYSSSKGHLVSMLFKPSGKKPIYPVAVDVFVKCSCPAWLYWGNEYQATKGNYWLDSREFRYPFIRDPKEEHFLCKHVVRVRLDLRNITFNRLDKKKTILSSAQLLPVLPIEDCYPAIESFFEVNKLSEVDSFLKSLNEENFESKLLEAKIIT